MNIITRNVRPEHFRAAPANEFSFLRALTSLDGSENMLRPTTSFERKFDEKARESFTNLDGRGFWAPWSSIRSIQASGSFTTGGALGQEQHVNMVAPAIRPSSFAVQAGMQTVDASGVLVYPRFSTACTATWVSELAPVPSVDLSVAALSLAPRAVGCQITLSAQLLMQVDGVEEWIRRELRAAIGQAIDGAVVAGVGGVEPTGISRQAGTAADVTFGGAPTWTDVLEFEAGLGSDNVEDLASHRFVMSHETRKRWKSTLRDGGGGCGYLIEGSTCNGYPVIASNFMAGSGAAHKVLFGAFSEVYLASFGPGIQIIVDNLTGAAQRLVKLTAFAMVDLGIRRPGTWEVSTDAGNQ